MYFAMSRLKVVSAKETEFELAWKKCESSIDGIKGFKKINLIKRTVNKDFSLYIFHSEWNSEKDFINWTESNLFISSHKSTIPKNNLYLGLPDFDGYIGPPDFEGFKVVI
tara:strand:- start:374 stop:703 length:330 start_codon:yes stop_codon:yes gene_type:complete